MEYTNCIRLVLGISSTGKSSYISAKMDSGEWPAMPVFMAYEVNKEVAETALQQACIVHYNLFRTFGNKIENIKNDLLDDPLLRALLSLKSRVKASFLIVSRSELIKRILLRQDTEARIKATTDAYPSQRVAELIFMINLEGLYKKWFGLLQESGIEFELINATNGAYRPIASVAEAMTIACGNDRVPYSEQEIDYIIKTNRFEYQQIQVSLAKATAGQDRSGTLQLLDDDLTGKTLFDIGCAYGYFCFEAEKRHARRVVGTELKRHRFLGCNILKEILGSNCSFYYHDIFNNPINEQFDIVLFLNVIHHLHEPVRALRTVAGMVREKLIMEFPTLSDEKFRATLPHNAVIDPALPLIGVSVLSSQGQTFLFSEEAIRRIFMDQSKLFSRIEFQSSPMAPERRIAICYK
jgi:2-polyprenyl-3-methyl-5-hydroxy-6-metoxy-1,4-benzoquinol methylase